MEKFDLDKYLEKRYSGLKLERIKKAVFDYEDLLEAVNAALNMPVVSGSLPEVTLMNEQKLGDTFINWKELSPEKQWQRIDAMLHEIGLKVVRQ